jgi:hypothetical protein
MISVMWQSLTLYKARTYTRVWHMFCFLFSAEILKLDGLKGLRYTKEQRFGVIIQPILDFNCLYCIFCVTWWKLPSLKLSVYALFI